MRTAFWDEAATSTYDQADTIQDQDRDDGSIVPPHSRSAYDEDNWDIHYQR